MTQAAPIQQPGASQGSTKLVMVAMALAILAVVLYNLSISIVRSEVRKAQFVVYKLAQEVRAGQPLSKKALQTILVPDTKEFRQAMKQLKVYDGKTLQSRIDTKNFKLKRTGFSGQLVTHDLFEDQDELTGSKILEGYREYPLKIKGHSVGAIRRGVRVDINAPLATGGEITESVLVMENVKVVALGLQSLRESRDGNSQSRSFSTITVEVKPQVARHLAALTRLMGGESEFELHLRNPKDVKNRETKEDQISERVIKILKKALPPEAFPK
jgi:hypothetical protein